MNRILNVIYNVVPIIVPSDPSARAAVGEDLLKIGEWLLLGAILAAMFEGAVFVVKSIIRLIRHIKSKKERSENENC